ncbi:MAG: hypothetical protein NZ820_08305 [Dehalococcoidia bacterium]|nr:hypothetical protein [Dehalococcoidia bacterium]
MINALIEYSQGKDRLVDIPESLNILFGAHKSPLALARTSKFPFLVLASAFGFLIQIYLDLM